LGFSGEVLALHIAEDDPHLVGQLDLGGFLGVFWIAQ
jgi:hypothetical protein